MKWREGQKEIIRQRDKEHKRKAVWREWVKGKQKKKSLMLQCERACVCAQMYVRLLVFVVVDVGVCMCVCWCVCSKIFRWWDYVDINFLKWHKNNSEWIVASKIGFAFFCPCHRNFWPLLESNAKTNAVILYLHILTNSTDLTVVVLWHIKLATYS